MACNHTPAQVKVSALSWAFEPHEPVAVDLVCKCGEKWTFSRRLSREVIHWPVPRHPNSATT